MDWHPKLFTWLWPDVPARAAPLQGYDAPIHGLRGLLHLTDRRHRIEGQLQILATQRSASP